MASKPTRADSRYRSSGDGTQHLGLFHQVIHRLMDVGEAVDLTTGEMGGCGHEIGVLRIARQSIGHGGGVDMAADKRMIDDFAAVQQLALHIDPDLRSRRLSLYS